MIFSSFTFIYLFLPIAWIAYWLIRPRFFDLGAFVLVSASLFFYAYWNIYFLPLLLISILVNFALGNTMVTQRDMHKSVRWQLVLGIAFNLSLLAFFKYANFFSDSMEYLTGFDPIGIEILLPIGISFFTFQQITYLIDVSRGNAGRYRLIHYVLFVSFFPQLIAGPIVHHSEMMPQFFKETRINWRMIAVGMAIFTAGLFKKLVLADNISPYTIKIFSSVDSGLSVTFFEAWGALIAYSFQMYFDFSGYCDMAIGLGLMFCIRLPINFDSPYKSATISEYWRRWHITLGRFLTSYLYVPLGGSRRGEVIRLRNLMIVMTLSGLWHGAGFGFVLWGALNGFWLWCNYASARFHKAIGREGHSLIPHPVAVFMTFLAVSIGWCLFRPATLDGGVLMLRTALGLNGLTVPEVFAAYLGTFADTLCGIGIVFEGPSYVTAGEWAKSVTPLIALSIVIVWGMPNTNQLFLTQIEEYSVAPSVIFPAWRPGMIGLATTATTFLLALLFAGSISEFLYFQF